MPRPRTASNADILEGTLRAISRLGPARLTLADVAAEVGLAPATLIQRFGSKRALLLAVVENAVESVESCFADVRASHPSPLDALVAAATDATRHVESPEALANHLAFLQIDLSDADFHRLALENSRRILAGYRSLIEGAVSAGELAPCNAERLARAIQAVTGGSLISWAIHRDGPVIDRLREDLETLLEPYRRAAPVAAAIPSPHPPPPTPLHLRHPSPPSGAPRDTRPSGPRARHTSGAAPAVGPVPPGRRSGV